PDLAAIIEAEKLHFHGVALFDHVRNFGNTPGRQFRHMHQSVAGAEEVHEGAEVDDLDDLAVINLTEFRLRHDGFDPFERGVDRLARGGSDLHRAVVGNVDLGAGLLDDLANDLAAGADHFADLVGWDGDDFDPRGIFAESRPCPFERFRHLAEDVEAAIAGLPKRRLHDLFGDAGDLDVHLERGHATGGSRHLEIHVAQMILIAQDVGEHGEALAFLDEADGDAG